MPGRSGYDGTLQPMGPVTAAGRFDKNSETPFFLAPSFPTLNPRYNLTHFKQTWSLRVFNSKPLPRIKISMKKMQIPALWS
uniref:Uncharacterized protein n=1 Tax=Pyxicephalus adspersus TaxID=30357 RepID=A0AAV2ZGB5_PYXAD|nr:TPA: hypothetical protein GDO54_003314 [Pyxicephalus adspersus]